MHAHRTWYFIYGSLFSKSMSMEEHITYDAASFFYSLLIFMN